jgi:hypothetical protein
MPGDSIELGQGWPCPKTLLDPLLQPLDSTFVLSPTNGKPSSPSVKRVRIGKQQFVNTLESSLDII